MRTLTLLFIAFGVSANGAAPAVVLGSGYSPPSPTSVAPGQVITFYVSGIGAGLTSPVMAGALPLPTSLGGISVDVVQFNSPIPAPVLAVFPITDGGCYADMQPQCPYTAVTVQIPFEMRVGYPGVSAPPPSITLLRFNEKGVTVATIVVQPNPDQIHLLNSCDSVYSSFFNPCGPVVTHADGTYVTSLAPALVGEEVVLYAVGLGSTFPVARTGEAPTSAVPVQAAAVGFDLNPNAGPSQPPITFYLFRDFVPAISPAYAGMVPGSVGLYQINVIVPPLPADAKPCKHFNVAPPITSNMTINVGGFVSFDGVGICVQPGS